MTEVLEMERKKMICYALEQEFLLKKMFLMLITKQKTKTVIENIRGSSNNESDHEKESDSDEFANMQVDCSKLESIRILFLLSINGSTEMLGEIGYFCISSHSTS